MVKRKLALRILKKKIDTLVMREEKKEEVKEPPLSILIPEKIYIPACDGTERCLASGHFFPIRTKEECDVIHLTLAVNKPTKAAKVRVYELRHDATFGQMFKHLRRNPRRMCLTEAQICTFINENKQILTDGDFVFFPFALQNGKVALLQVTYYPEISTEQFSVYTYPMWNLRPWNSKFRVRVVAICPK